MNDWHMIGKSIIHMDNGSNSRKQHCNLRWTPSIGNWALSILRFYSYIEAFRKSVAKPAFICSYPGLPRLENIDHVSIKGLNLFLSVILESSDNCCFSIVDSLSCCLKFQPFFQSIYCLSFHIHVSVQVFDVFLTVLCINNPSV